MRLITLFLLLSISTNCGAQMLFSAVKHDFGELESYDNRFVDVTITNQGPKQGYILSVRKPMEVVYIQNRSLIEKDSSLTLRFQVNPREKGKFSYEVQVFTSDKPEATIVKLTGTLREMSQESSNYMTACPDFGTHPPGKRSNGFDMTVITIDQQTREELSKSAVTMIQNGREQWSERTDSKGKINKEATIGLAYFFARHEGYLDAEKGAFVSNDRHTIVIELTRDPNYSEPVPEIVVVTPEPVEIEITLEEELTQETSTPLTTEIPPALTEIDEENFDEQYFEPVNVVFVLDVSSSMNQSEKMELMKYALHELAEMLRPQDRIGIVTYSSDARVLLEPTSGSQKDPIYAQVDGLKASGMTAGGEGIKLGFKQAEKGFISDGTNHVIVITDGAFNRNSEDYKKYVKKYAKKNIHMSVVGIRNQEKDRLEMEEAAALGGGSYIPIFKLADAQKNLKQAIRVLSFKGAGR